MTGTRLRAMSESDCSCGTYWEVVIFERGVGGNISANEADLAETSPQPDGLGYTQCDGRT